jgi:hypothetical protein
MNTEKKMTEQESEAMTHFIRNVLCFIGIHSFVETSDDARVSTRVCGRCTKINSWINVGG